MMLMLELNVSERVMGLRLGCDGMFEFLFEFLFEFDVECLCDV